MSSVTESLNERILAVVNSRLPGDRDISHLSNIRELSNSILFAENKIGLLLIDLSYLSYKNIHTQEKKIICKNNKLKIKEKQSECNCPGCNGIIQLNSKFNTPYLKRLIKNDTTTPVVNEFPMYNFIIHRSPYSCPYCKIELDIKLILKN